MQSPRTMLKQKNTQQILCVACSQFQEWDRENVIMTGSSDGVVRMWSLDFVEVPITEKLNTNENKDENSVQSGRDEISENTPTPTVLQSLTQQLAKKMSVSYELGNYTLRSLQEILAANVYVTTPQPHRRNTELKN